MFDRLLVAAVFSWFGVAGLLPVPPLTPAQMQANAKQKQTSEICKRKKKSKTVKEMCKRWEARNA
jgi:hypothetical protein